MNVPFGYLDRQFAQIDPFLEDIRKLIASTDLTLGEALEEFEARFAKLCGMPHAIGVASGTDALMLSLKMLGIGPGDEVITATNTFIATAGAIAMAGAKPVFVDCEGGFVIDPTKIEAAITPRTKALLPVHFTGNVADMPVIMEIARRHKLLVVEDACQALLGAIDGKPVGTWGSTVCFSLHPLKNLNVWGDGGLIVTRDGELARKLRLFRNHGLVNRDAVEFFGHNSRLDTLQAVIGNRLIDGVQAATERRIGYARRYDEAFADLAPRVRVPVRRPGVRHVFHLYIVEVEQRDALLSHLNKRGIKAKVHYPIPLHLQQASAHLGYKQGDFPVAEAQTRTIITLPAHPYLTPEEVEYTIREVRAFYGAS